MPDPSDFSYRATGDGRVFIDHRGRRAAVLEDGRAAKCLAAVERADEAGAQLEMARVTGNYKRGNER